MQKQIEFKPKVFEVPSETDKDKTYLVTNYRPDRWSCTCKDYIYRSHDDDGYSTNHKCKHIKDIIKKIEGGEL